MEDQIKQKNFDEICRLCLEYASETTSLYPIFINEDSCPGYYGRFSTEFKESIPEIISACIGIKLDPTDKLPMGICSACEAQLIASNKFRHKCMMSNNYLLELKLNPEDDDEEYDSEDHAPLNSLKPPELILVDSIKEESNDGLDDNGIGSSACDLAWSTFQSEDEAESKLSIMRSGKRLVKKSKDENSIKKSAVKTSITIPLVIPTTPIVPVISNDLSDSNKDLFRDDTQKQLERRRLVKKANMCTVCGMMVKRLRDHMKIHPNALDYCCSHCSRKYLTKQGLIKHINITHTEDSSLENKNNGFNDADRYPNKDLWNCNLRKRFRQMGETYIGIDGSAKIGRAMKKSCPTSCYLQCQDHFDDTKRLQIHKSFWKLTDHEKYRYYATNVKRICSVRKRTKAERSRRLFSFIYFFENCNDEHNQRTQVCQKFFVNTLDISKGRIYYYFQNIHDCKTVTPKGGRYFKKKKNENISLCSGTDE